jgi:hypothetical protein
MDEELFSAAYVNLYSNKGATTVDRFLGRWLGRLWGDSRVCCEQKFSDSSGFYPYVRHLMQSWIGSTRTCGKRKESSLHKPNRLSTQGN